MFEIGKIVQKIRQLFVAKKNEEVTQSEQLGEVIGNIKIEVDRFEERFPKGPWGDHSLINTARSLENANKFLRGEWRVTENGYLLKSCDDTLPCIEVTLDISHNNWLSALDRVVSGELDPTKILRQIHLHIKNTGELIYITVDRRGIKLQSSHEFFSSPQNPIKNSVAS